MQLLLLWLLHSRGCTPQNGQIAQIALSFKSGRPESIFKRSLHGPSCLQQLLGLLAVLMVHLQPLGRLLLAFPALLHLAHAPKMAKNPYHLSEPRQGSLVQISQGVCRGYLPQSSCLQSLSTAASKVSAILAYSASSDSSSLTSPCTKKWPKGLIL